MRTRRPLYALLLVASACLPAPGQAQEAGDTIVKQGQIKEDLYLAGGTVEVLADVDGDVIAAGGQINVDRSVSGDVMAAGGNVAVRARVGDDVRVAGGNVTISGSVGDDVIAAGGQVLLAPNVAVGGRAWLGGNSVRVDGRIGEELKAAGSSVVIAGQIGGDVELYANTIEIRPGAVIRGNVTYYSRNEAQIADDAKIAGTVTRRQLRAADEGMREGLRAVGAVVRVGLYISLMLTGIVLYLLFPQTSVGAARTINEAPWKSLGLGLALLATTPLVVVLLFLSLVGVWLALLALTLYLMLLLLGFLVGVLNVGDWSLRLIRRSTPTKGWRVLSIVAALVALWIVRLVPVLGGVVVFALLVFGLGALALYLWRRYVSA